MAGKFKFDKIIKNIEQVKRDLPRLMSNDAQNYFLKAFQKQGWDGKNWKEVQRRIPGTAAYKYPLRKGLSRRTKPVLMGTGRLRRAVSNLAGRSRVSYSRYNFKVTLSITSAIVPYAEYLNSGTSKIDKRQFMGSTYELKGILRGRINRYVSNTFR